MAGRHAAQQLLLTKLNADVTQGRLGKEKGYEGAPRHSK